MRSLAPRVAHGALQVLQLLLMLLAMLSSPLIHASTALIAAKSASVGESIYRHGVLGSGMPLAASRGEGLSISGGEAACLNCHQRSGLGAKAGNRFIPPLAGAYLFRVRPKDGDDSELPFVEGMHGAREPYTDTTLARAIREGLDSEGRPLDDLMPRFELNDVDMAALIDYLKSLGQAKVPGVSDTVLHFATIITPDADQVKVAGMLDVLRQFFADKNAFPVGATPRLHSSRKMMFMANRHWQLHVWRLNGAPSTWTQQLERHLAEEPVLAVISGQGRDNWVPVQAFCEQKSIPCLFPNVEVPPIDADQYFYSMYFSKGILLEADLIANQLNEAGASKTPKVVRQIYRAGDSGEAGAKALTVLLERRGIKVRRQVLASGALGQGVAQAIRHNTSADALVLWLRPADLQALGPVPDASTSVFMSSLMGGLDRSPLPPAWRNRTQLAYPFDLPGQRRVRVDFARGWFAIRHIAVVDEQVQTDTYLACSMLAETLSHMADTFVHDYLVERVVDTLEHRIITGYYPRLTLASGQRFASKGGYFVRFADESSTTIVPESEWIRP